MTITVIGKGDFIVEMHNNLENEEKNESLSFEQDKTYINFLEIGEPRISWIQEMVDQISRSRFEMFLRHLVSYPTRLSTSPYFIEAATWSQSQLEAMGYDTRIENIGIGSETTHNVIADKKGLFRDKRNLIIVSAHLDSVNHEGGPHEKAPGADDNGSGCAGLLEIAHVFRKLQTEHDLRFILFGGEEQGLFGSKQYINNLSEEEKSRIKAVINMDMIGSLNTSIPTVLLEGAPISQSIINRLKEVASIYTQLEVETSLNPFDSDHVPFIQANIPAVLTIEGADSANHSEHTSDDTLDRINYELALEILRMNVAFIAFQVKKEGLSRDDIMPNGNENTSQNRAFGKFQAVSQSKDESSLPTRRTCGTMDLHRTLLKQSEEYRRQRSKIDSTNKIKKENKDL